MERIIKFRVWDSNEKDWCYFDDDEGKRSIYGDLKSIATQSFIGVVDNNSEYNPNLIWMQFTGMYDRNDNEIWEGDVLNQYNSYDKNTAKIIETSQVKWDDIANCGCCGQIVAMGFDIESDPRLVEVIGNIYENPELA